MSWTDIFNDVPPTEDELVKKLFVNRETELEDVLDTYQGAHVAHGKVLAIHGEQRSGKSHLARRALVELKEKKDPMILVAVNANECQTADKLLRRIYNSLADTLLAVSVGQRASQERKDIFDFARARAATIQKLLGTGVQEMTVEHSRGSIERVQRQSRAKVGTGIKGKILGFIEAHVSGEIERGRTSGEESSEQERTSYTIATPSEEGLAREIGFLAAALVYLQRNKERVLLFVDDMDLLSYGLAVSQEAEHEMSTHLASLASEEAINVIATVRSDLYAQRERHFGELGDPLGPMTPEELQEVHRRRVQAYAPGREFFTADALGLLATGTRCLVGDFLGFAKRAYRSLRHEAETPSAEAVEGYFRGRWQYVTQAIPAEATQHIQQRLREGTVQFSGDELRREGFEPATSPLVSEGVIKPVPYRTDYYRMREIYAQAVRPAAEGSR